MLYLNKIIQRKNFLCKGATQFNDFHFGQTHPSNQNQNKEHILFPPPSPSPFCLLSLTLTETLFSGSERECSVLANFTLNSEDRVTFEWENEKMATANLTKENGECIYRYLSLLFSFHLVPKLMEQDWKSVQRCASLICSSGWWAGLDPKLLPQELWHGFSRSWESSIW